MIKRDWSKELQMRTALEARLVTNHLHLQVLGTD